MKHLKISVKTTENDDEEKFNNDPALYWLERNAKNSFTTRLTKPTMWKMMAEKMKRAADILYERYYAAFIRDQERFFKLAKEGKSNSHILEGEELEDYHDTELLTIYFLLTGYAIENLLKGIYVLRNHNDIENILRNYQLKTSPIKTHNLKRLAVIGKVPLTPEEEYLLAFLTRSISWAGKYLVPLTLTSLMETLDIPNGSPKSIYGRVMQQQLNALYVKLWQNL